MRIPDGPQGFRPFNNDKEASNWLAGNLSKMGIPAFTASYGEEEFGEGSGTTLVLGENEDTRLNVSYSPDSGLIKVGNTLFTRAFIGSSKSSDKETIGIFENPHEFALRMLGEASYAAKRNNIAFGDAFSALTDPLPRPGIATDIRTMPNERKSYYDQMMVQLYPRGMNKSAISGSSVAFGEQMGFVPTESLVSGEDFIPSDDDDVNPEILKNITLPYAHIQTSINQARLLGQAPGYSYNPHDHGLVSYDEKNRAGKVGKDIKRFVRERWMLDPSKYRNEGTLQAPKQLIMGVMMQERMLGEGRSILGQLHDASAVTTFQKKAIALESSLDLSKLKLAEGMEGADGKFIPREGAILASDGKNDIRLPSTNFSGSTIGQIYLGIGTGDRVIGQLTKLLGAERYSQIKANFIKARPDSEEERQQILDLVKQKTGFNPIFGVGANNAISLVFSMSRSAEDWAFKNQGEKDVPIYNKGVTEFLKENNIDYATAAQNIKHKAAKVQYITDSFRTITEKDKQGNYIYSGKKYDSVRNVAEQVLAQSKQWEADGVKGIELREKELELYDQLAPRLKDPETGEEMQIFPSLQPGVSVEYPGEGSANYDIVNWVSKTNPVLSEELINTGVQQNPYLRMALSVEGGESQEVKIPEQGIVTDEGLTSDNRIREISKYLSSQVRPGQIFNVAGVNVPHPDDVLANGTSAMKQAVSELFMPYADAWKTKDGNIGYTEFKGSTPYSIPDQMKDRAQALQDATAMHLAGNAGASDTARKKMLSLMNPGRFYAKLQATPDLKDSEARFGRTELRKIAKGLGVSEEQVAKMGPIPFLFQRHPASKGPLYFSGTFDKNIKSGFQMSIDKQIDALADSDGDSGQLLPLLKRDSNNKIVPMEGALEAILAQGKDGISSLRTLATVGGEKAFNEAYERMTAAKGSAPTAQEMIRGFDSPTGWVAPFEAGKQNVVGGAIKDGRIKGSPLSNLINKAKSAFNISGSDVAASASSTIKSKQEMSGFLVTRALMDSVKKENIQAASEAFPTYQAGLRGMAEAGSIDPELMKPGSLIGEQVANPHIAVLDMEESSIPFAIEGFNYGWLGRWASHGKDGGFYNYKVLAQQDFKKIAASNFGDPETVAMMFSPSDPEKMKKVAQYVKDVRANKNPKFSEISDITVERGSPYAETVRARVATLLRSSYEEGKLIDSGDGTYRLNNGSSVITQKHLDEQFPISDEPLAVEQRKNAVKRGNMSSVLEAISRSSVGKKIGDAAAGDAGYIRSNNPSYSNKNLKRTLQGPNADVRVAAGEKVVNQQESIEAAIQEMDTLDQSFFREETQGVPPQANSPQNNQPQQESQVQEAESPPIGNSQKQHIGNVASAIDSRFTDMNYDNGKWKFGSVALNVLSQVMKQNADLMRMLQGGGKKHSGRNYGARYKPAAMLGYNKIVTNYLDQDGNIAKPLIDVEKEFPEEFAALDDDSKSTLKNIDLFSRGMLGKQDVAKAFKYMNMQASGYGWIESGQIGSNGSRIPLEGEGRLRGFIGKNIGKAEEMAKGIVHDDKSSPLFAIFQRELNVSKDLLKAFNDAIKDTTIGEKERGKIVKEMAPALQKMAMRLEDTSKIPGARIETPESRQQARLAAHELRGGMLPESQGGLIPDSIFNTLSDEDRTRIRRGALQGGAEIENKTARTGEKLLSAMFAMQTIRSLRYTFNPIIQDANEYATNQANLMGMYSQAIGVRTSLGQQFAVLRANTTLSNIGFGIGQNATQIVGGAGKALENLGVNGSGPLGYLMSVGSPAFGVATATTLAISSATANPGIGLAAGAVTGGLALIGGMVAYGEGAKNDQNARIRSDILSSMGYKKTDIAKFDSAAYASTEGAGLNPIIAANWEGITSLPTPRLFKLMADKAKETLLGQSPLYERLYNFLYGGVEGTRTDFSSAGKNVIDRLAKSPFDWSGLSSTEVAGMMESVNIAGSPLSKWMDVSELKDMKKRMSVLTTSQIAGDGLSDEEKTRLAITLGKSDASVLSGGAQYQLDLASKLASARGDNRWNAGARLLSSDINPLSSNAAMQEIGAWQMVGGRQGLAQFNALSFQNFNIGQYGNMLAGMNPQQTLGMQLFQQASPQMLSRMYASNGWTVPGQGFAGTYTMDTFNNSNLFQFSAWGTPGLDMSNPVTSYDQRNVPFVNPAQNWKSIQNVQNTWGLSYDSSKAFMGGGKYAVGGLTGLNWYMRDLKYDNQMTQFDLQAGEASARRDFSLRVERPMARANFEMDQASMWGGNVSTSWGTYNAGAGKFAWEKRSMAINLADLNAGYDQQMTRLGWNYQDINRQQLQAGVRANWQRQDFEIQGMQMTMNRQMQSYDYARSSFQLARQKQYASEDFAYSQQMRGLQFGWNMEDLDTAIRRSTGFERKQLIKRKDREEQQYTLEGGQIDKQRSRQEEQFKLEDQHMKIQRQHVLEMQKLEDINFSNSKKRFEEEQKWRNESADIEKSRLGEQGRWITENHERQLASFAIRAEQLMAEESQAKVSSAMQKERMEEQFKLDDRLYGIQMARVELAKREFIEVSAIQKAIDAMQVSAEKAQRLVPGMMDEIAYGFIKSFVEFANSSFVPMGVKPMQMPKLPENNPWNQYGKDQYFQSDKNGATTQNIYVVIDGKEIARGTAKYTNRTAKVDTRAQYAKR